MKRIFFALFLLFSSLNAEVIKAYPTQKLLQSHIPIVDIRTPPEWRHSGIIKGAIPITFFDSKGRYNLKKFLHELNSNVDTTKPFAIICHTGRRTAAVADFLAKQFNYTVIDLVGGMEEAAKRKMPIVPYL